LEVGDAEHEFAAWVQDAAGLGPGGWEFACVVEVFVDVAGVDLVDRVVGELAQVVGLADVVNAWELADVEDFPAVFDDFAADVEAEGGGGSHGKK